MVRLKNINKVRAKGRIYYYHRPTRKRFTADYGTAAFVDQWRSFESGLARAAAREQPGTLGALIKAYRGSPEFRDLRPATKKQYDKVLDWLATIEDLPLALIDTPGILQLRDRAFATKKRRFANSVKDVLSLLFSWGIPRNYIASNPAKACPRLRRPKNAPIPNRPWSAEELTEVLAACYPGMKAAVALGTYAGLREEDVVVIAWSAYDGQEVETRQLKTGEPIRVAAHRALREILDSTPKIAVTIVTGMRGRPFLGQDGFRTMFFRIVRKLEREGKVKKGLTFHGLRHTSATMLADAGCDTRDIAAVLGQKTDAMAAHYARHADRRRRAKDIALLEGAEQTVNKNCKPDCKT